MTASVLITAVLAELSSIHEFLNAAQEIVRMGHMPDIQALQGRVANVCKEIEGAEKAVQADALPELKKVLAHLDELTADMKAWKEKQS